MKTDGGPAFRTIVADPPWPSNFGPKWAARTDKARPQNRYKTLTVEEICQFPISRFKTEQAHLYLWCVAQRVDWAYRVADAWGFSPIILLTWVKSGLGVGRFRCNTEHILVARCGSRHNNPFGFGGRHTQATNGTAFNWPRKRHSEKPEMFYALVEKLSPGPRLELFARVSRPGWIAWGNEIGDPLKIGFNPNLWKEGDAMLSQEADDDSA